MDSKKSPRKKLSEGLNNANPTVGSPRVAVGEPFTEHDVQLVNKTGEIKHDVKPLTTIVLVIATVVFYGVYMAHEWWAGNSFSAAGLFLQNVIFALVGWCIGKSTSDRASP